MGLYKVLAITAMRLQKEASVWPLISDVVTALEFLSTPSRDEEEAARDETKPPSGGNIAVGRVVNEPSYS